MVCGLCMCKWQYTFTQNKKSVVFVCVCVRGQLHQQCCEEWTLVSEETKAKMARMAAAAAWGLGEAKMTMLKFL